MLGEGWDIVTCFKKVRRYIYKYAYSGRISQIFGEKHNEYCENVFIYGPVRVSMWLYKVFVCECVWWVLCFGVKLAYNVRGTYGNEICIFPVP